MAAAFNSQRSTSRLVNIWGSRAAAQRFKRERFDVDSGQVFTETTVEAPRNGGEMSEMARLENFFDEAKRRRRPGAPSLEEVAMRSFLRSIDSVTSETLLGLAWGIGLRLWKEAEALDLARPSIWSAFAAAYPHEPQFQYYRSSEITPSKTFSEYIEYLDCPNFEWLTCLTLSKINVERVDIMRVSELSNLVAMDIYSSGHDLDQDYAAGVPFSIVDDQVVRNWGRRAQENASFSKLRVMILRNQRHLTARSLEYLSSFPLLVLFGVSGCSVTSKHWETAEKHGWTLDEHRGLLAQIKSDIDKSHTWDGPLTACTKYSASLLGEPIDTDPKDPPILSYRLGPTSMNVLYSIPLIFFRRSGRNTTTPGPPNPETETAGDTTTIAPPASAPASAPAPASTHPSEASHGHLAKKRKIKVSAQRSFDSTLADLGVEIARPTISAKINSDPSLDELSVDASTRSPAHSFPKPSSNPTTPNNNILVKRRQARQERERPWRQSRSDKA